MSSFLPFPEAIAELEAGMPPHPDSGFLGARLSPADAHIHLIPVPWEVTTSYGGGTAEGPEAIRAASHQLDLEDPFFGRPYRAGIALLDTCEDICRENARLRPLASRVIEALETGSADPDTLAEVNRGSVWLNDRVYALAKSSIDQGKLVGLVGGDHATPFGLIRALAEQHPDGFGILHIDAHLDLRAAYEGFDWSHASIFHNVMTCIPEVHNLVQVAMRDYSKGEVDFAESLGDRSSIFLSNTIFRRKAQGEAFVSILDEIIDALPEKVYLSFDIDGLDPVCCPGTGTPVPGGLSFDEGSFLIERLVERGKRVIGFDLCEVSPREDDEWDANVGARILYKLCGSLALSNRG